MSDKASSKSQSEKRKASRIAKPIDIVLRCPDKTGKSFIEKTRLKAVANVANLKMKDA